MTAAANDPIYSDEEIKNFHDETAPCCTLRQFSSDENREETEFLLSIPRNLRKTERRLSDDSSRDCTDDVSTRVEVASLPGMDYTESVVADDQASHHCEDSRPSSPVTEEPSTELAHRESTEQLPPGLSETVGNRPCGNFNCSIVCEATETGNMSSESYLRDYYEQLPSETADFEDEDSKDLFGVSQVRSETTPVQQPQAPTQDPFDIQPTSVESSLASELSLGSGLASFEPAPAASFEPAPVASSELEQHSPDSPFGIDPVPTKEVDDVTDDRTFAEEPQPEDCGNSDKNNMSSEQEHQEESAIAEFEQEVDEQQFEAEAEPQMMVQSDPKQEDILVQDVEDSEQEERESTPPPPVDIKEEKVADLPPPAVEEIVTKKEPSPSLMSHVPASADDQKEVAQVEGDKDPVVDLIYWRDIKKTAFVFTFLLMILGSLVCYSVISVAAYAGLALLTVTVAFRLYKIVLQTLNGTQQPHPFQEYLDMDITLSQDRVQKYTSSALCQINCCLTGARNLFLVQNTISSLKLGVFLWLLTYIGGCFNGLTLLIIDVILLFTVPPFYEKYQTQIDNYLGIARGKIGELTATIKAKLPGAKQAQKEKAQ